MLKKLLNDFKAHLYQTQAPQKSLQKMRKVKSHSKKRPLGSNLLKH